jgi:hypothetical protein
MEICVRYIVLCFLSFWTYVQCHAHNHMFTVNYHHEFIELTRQGRFKVAADFANEQLDSLSIMIGKISVAYPEFEAIFTKSSFMGLSELAKLFLLSFEKHQSMSTTNKSIKILFSLLYQRKVWTYESVLNWKRHKIFQKLEKSIKPETSIDKISIEQLIDHGKHAMGIIIQEIKNNPLEDNLKYIFQDQLRDMYPEALLYCVFTGNNLILAQSFSEFFKKLNTALGRNIPLRTTKITLKKLL